ncbi:MAG: hypothetical protein H0U60_00130 [Blastocatellia bacterium]|nr:hypothetical protein [Blastocatellia bacterium]
MAKSITIDVPALTQVRIFPVMPNGMTDAAYHLVATYTVVSGDQTLAAPEVALDADKGITKHIDAIFTSMLKAARGAQGITGTTPKAKTQKGATAKHAKGKTPRSAK